LQASLNFPPHARCQSRPSIRPTRQYSTNRSKNVPACKYHSGSLFEPARGAEFRGLEDGRKPFPALALLALRRHLILEK